MLDSLEGQTWVDPLNKFLSKTLASTGYFSQLDKEFEVVYKKKE